MKNFNQFHDVAESAEYYYRKYRPQLDALISNNTMRDIRESLTEYEIVGMGRQLDQFKFYSNTVSESFSGQAPLGKLPEIALDVITASYGNSIIPLLASTQPLDEQKGLVYFRSLYAAQASGGYTKGQVISDPFTPTNVGDGTLGQQRKTVEIAKGASGGATKEYNSTVVGPLRPYTVEVAVEGLGFAKDDGYGHLLTYGNFEGSVDYEAGKITVITDAGLAEGKKVTAMFDVDVDVAPSIDKIQASLTTKEVSAEIWTLAADVGFFASIALQKRWGRRSEDMVAEDLTAALTNSLNARAVKTIAAQVKGDPVKWSQNPPQGVSHFEHKATFVDALAQAERNIFKASGAHNVNRIIVGTNAAAVLRGLPNWKSADLVAGSSIGLYGFLDNVPVIRATNLVGDNDVIALSNPQDNFNSPLAYCPFMPLMLTDTVQDPQNPFRGTRAAGVWAGFASMNENLVTKIEITPATQFGV